MSVGADGVQLYTESVRALIGGLAFDTPPFAPASEAAAAMKAPDAIARRYALYFKESLRGLAVGAPVTLLGLPAGEVTSIGLEFDAAKGNVRSRVVITYVPERLLAYANAKADALGSAAVSPAEQKRRDIVAHLVEERGLLLRRLVEERGLRGQLRTGSLLTGQLYVSFDFYPGAPKAKVDLRQQEPELPVVPSTLVELEDSSPASSTRSTRCRSRRSATTSRRTSKASIRR